MTLTIGVSLKMYFGYDQTLRWCREVATKLGSHETLTSGDTRLFVLPSFPAIPGAAEIFRGTPIAVGAQDLHPSDHGAHTGDVGGPMLREAGSRYVEVGHAERRVMHGEDEDVVAAKTAAALRNGLIPVVCIGEQERVSADVAAVECVRQLRSALHVAERTALGGSIVVAYEPFWAIGASQPAADDHIATVCHALREALRHRPAHPGSSVIYGGSAGPGMLSRLAGSVDGLFLGRFAHDPAALAAVLDETVGSAA